MHSKSSFTYMRLITIALTVVAATVLGLVLGPHKSAAAPAGQGQGKTALGSTGQSRRAGTRRPPKRDESASPNAINTSLDEVKLIASEGEELGRAGWSVAISGKTAVVGTKEQKAYVFERRDNTWDLKQTLEAEPGAVNFGWEVAIDKDTIVVGSSGAAYVYVPDGETWALQRQLLSPVPSDSFAHSVAISGDRLVIGDWLVDDNAGAVYFYERNGTTWSGPLKLSCDDHSPSTHDDYCGYAVTIKGDTAVVTAPGADVVPNDFPEGAAYVYGWNGTAWDEQAYLNADEDELETTVYMGTAVAISGNTIVVGNQNRDRAFVFARTTSLSWAEQQMLRPFHGEAGDQFGVSVAINGDRIVVGAWGTDNNIGAAYIYDRTGSTWFEGDTLRSTTGVPSEGYLAFGNGVGISGDTIIVGAPSEQVGLNDFQGAAYVFQLPDTDGDGLPDDWEKNGVTFDGEFIDLKAMGADPKHKDIFVHADWMAEDDSRPGIVFHPGDTPIEMVSDAFATAPVLNPDSQPGIHLHVDLGPESIMNPVTGQTWGALSRAEEVPFQAELGSMSADGQAYDWAPLDEIKELHFKQTKRDKIFRYALFCNTIAGLTNTGVARDTPGTDFILAFGVDLLSGDENDTPLRKGSTFMHELGHTLGLLHGGADGVNDKPNYLSVMNYSFQLEGLLLGPDGEQRALDYSREALEPLVEDDLFEADGISDAANHLTYWYPRAVKDDPKGTNKCLANPDDYYQIFLPSAALDWNCDGTQNGNPVAADINGDGTCVSPGDNETIDSDNAGDDVTVNLRIMSGPNRICETEATADDEQESRVGYIQPFTLKSYNDWLGLRYDGGNRLGNLYGTGESNTSHTQITELTTKQLLERVPPALIHEEEVAPQDVVTFSPRVGPDPLPVSFDGSSSTAVNGTVVNWQWNFGDGTTGSGASVAHTYATVGVYFASLTVTDSNGHKNLVPLRHQVTVNSLRPNLTPFQPPSWSDKIVVSTTTGTNLDSTELTTNDTLYIDSAVLNNGSAPAAMDFTTKLYVDGVQAQTFLTMAPLNSNSVTAAQDLVIGPLSAGQHTLKVVADDTGAIPESDELDNEYSRVINISGANPTPTPTPTGQPNLTPYQPPSWSDKIVVSNATGTNVDSTTLNTTDTLYVDWAAINNGGTPTSGSFETKLFVDGIEKNTRVTSVAINPGGSFGAQDITIGSLSAGQHTVRVVLDSGGVITESNETDNEYIKTITVQSPLPTPSPTPTPLPVSQTYTVRNTNDSGADSLRQAIIDANSHPNAVGGIDQIAFNIPGGGVHTITPVTAYAAIADPVLLDGYTQPGASANTLTVGDNAVLLIEINGVNIGDDGLNFTAGNSTIRGLVINHFDSTIFSVAMRLGSSNNVVAGNFIGTNAAGTVGVRNLISVKIASGANNLIGGSQPADRNILGGSNTQNQPAAGAGLQILTTQPGTRVLGNYIGTNAAGTAALGNGRGIDLVGSPSADITIGGQTDTPGTGAGNVISGNSSNGGINSDGIYIGNRPGDLKIQGNLIGLDATGTTAVSNGVTGINFQDTVPGTSLLLVGGTQPGARNVIFNNKITGILSNAIGLIVQGNFIGTDITGTVRPPLAAGSADHGDGITVGGGSVLIGGNSAPARNVISCIGRGLRLASGSTTLQGNYIGTTVDGSTPLGNQPAGVRVENDAVAIIGGTAPGQGNLIAHSFTGGIEVRNNARATILGNSIFDNGTQDLSTFQGHPGIDLNNNGVTPNDSCDTDNGPNGLQNFPALISAVASVGSIKFLGSINSQPSTTYRIEFFANPSCEASGHGEGQIYVGSTTVNTDENCSAGINVTLPAAVVVGQFISTTATDSAGNTSEFGPCVQVTAGALPTAANGSVKGQITDTNGNAIAGVAINLTGTQNRLTITDEDGNYHFDNVETNGFYTVVPARANYSFIPAQRSFNALGSVTEAAFVAMSTGGGLNPLDTTEYFVRQQYLDFLGREPDESGFAFWTNQIRACGDDASCLEVRRVNTSAAFFLSLEFQRTGYQVYRTYRSAYGGIPGAPVPIMLDEFLCDTSKLGHGVVVNQTGWEQVLENNTQAFMNEFVQRSRFTTAFPSNMTPAQFVDALNVNADSALSASERNQLVSELISGAKTRAQVLRAVAEDADLNAAEFNRAFVLMQFYGYLRRNPNSAPDSDYTGYDFWLGKLNQFNGNFMNAEMVKAFIVSGEYRQRPGP